MTENEVVKKALAEVGVKENPPNSNNVKYNTLFYGHRVSGSQYAWCCTFIWWLLSTSGIPCPKTASCITLADYFKKQGRWTNTPQVGDIVFFHFNTNTRWTNHVGIVVGVKGNEITTVEGNTSLNSDDNGGCVQQRKRSKNIVGYGRPQYAPNENTLNLKPVLKKGDRGNYVKAWQEYLKTCGISCGKGGSDGIFGNDTEKAVKEYQKLKGLPVTGVIDQDDWNSVGK